MAINYHPTNIGRGDATCQLPTKNYPLKTTYYHLPTNLRSPADLPFLREVPAICGGWVCLMDTFHGRRDARPCVSTAKPSSPSITTNNHLMITNHSQLSTFNYQLSNLNSLIHFVICIITIFAIQLHRVCCTEQHHETESSLC